MAEYDHIASAYQEHRTKLVGSSVGIYNYSTLLGDIADRTVLELGCGEGFYTRVLKRKGVSHVLGVDISEKMIELARRQETSQPLGIEYRVSDVRDLGKVGEFDLVVASYLLNHAQSRKELLAMCRCIFANLTDGGRFFALNNNLELSPAEYWRLEKYGRKQHTTLPLSDGTPITVTLFGAEGEKSCSFTDFYLSKASYEWALRQAGFKEIIWHPPRVPSNAIEEYGHEFWQDYLDYPPLARRMR